jgi:hypothetical protein
MGNPIKFKFVASQRGITEFLQRDEDLGRYLMKIGLENSSKLARLKKGGGGGELIDLTHNTKSYITQSNKMNWYVSKPRQMYVYEVQLSEDEIRKNIIRGMQRFGLGEQAEGKEGWNV